MTVLAIDTSARTRFVVLVAERDGSPLREHVVTPARTDASLPPLLAELLDDSLEALVVVTGPGSYTGVRAGMAAALGVAQPRGLSLHGVGALDVIAAGAPSPQSVMWVAADAGRGAVYAARCGLVGGAPVCGPAVRVTLAELDRLRQGVPLASTDPLELDGVLRVDPAGALAAAVPRALAAPPLAQAALAAVVVT